MCMDTMRLTSARNALSAHVCHSHLPWCCGVLQVTNGGNSCRGSVSLRAGSAGTSYQSTPGGAWGNALHDMSTGSQMVAHWSRSANTVRAWSTFESHIEGLSSEQLADVLSAPVDTSSYRQQHPMPSGTKPVPPRTHAVAQGTDTGQLSCAELRHTACGTAVTTT